MADCIVCASIYGWHTAKAFPFPRHSPPHSYLNQIQGPNLFSYNLWFSSIIPPEPKCPTFDPLYLNFFASLSFVEMTGAIGYSSLHHY